MTRARRAAGIAAAALVLCAAPARAAKCLGETLTELPLLEAGDRSAVPVRLNGAPFALIVDTGATHVALTAAVAAQLGLNEHRLERAILAGIGGATAGGLIDLRELDLAGLRFREVNVPVVSLPLPSGALLTTAGVLGASVLSRFDVELDFAAGRLRLRAPPDCAPIDPPWRPGWSRLKLATEPSNLDGLMHHDDVTTAGTAFTSYRGLPYPDHARLFAQVRVNGQPMIALIDTGASISALTPDAAVRAGLPESGAALLLTGVGDRLAPGRLVTARVRIGADDRADVLLGVVEMDIGAADMILGRDLMLHRRVLLAYEAREMFWQSAERRR